MSSRTVKTMLGALLLSLTLPAFSADAPAQDGQAVTSFPIMDYHLESEFLPTTPAVSGGAAGAFGNPAAWATGDRVETAFWWNDRSIESGSLDNWGFSHGKTLGLAFNRRTVGFGQNTYDIDDFQIGIASGNRGGHFGFAYRWSSSDLDALPREDAFVVGLIGRPNRWYSLGLSGLFSTESSAHIGVADIGIRPLGRDWLTLFGDFSLRDGQQASEGNWGAGVEIRPVPGLHLGVKFRDLDRGTNRDYRYSFHVGVTVSGLGFHVLPAYDEFDELQTTSYMIRTGASYRSLPVEPAAVLRTSDRYVQVDLENKRLTYQRYRWFEKKRVAWLDLARRLDAIRDDKSVAGVCLNLAGFSARRSLAWELRQKLAELQAAGKEIIIHGDRLDMRMYHLASVADHLTLDPQGDVMLPGFSAKRTYLKGTLEKLGIGFQELRYFTHKSAMEAFARDDMSDADREQIGRLVDVLYEAVRDGVCRGRSLTPAQFDALVEDDVILTAAAARDRGLVDDVARWDDLGGWLDENRDGARLWNMPPDRGQRRYYEEVWGKPAKVAVVYALGPCDMDSGIKGRATSAYMRRLAGDRQVAAVVFRADSPGGDPLPSDLVAGAMTQLKEAGKPVIVTQGDVAGSGGYWISMDGSRILTTPATLTGSIGVIAGWFWDDGIGEKTGLSADGVQRGSHADLFRGIRFPLIGQSLPQRPLDSTELGMVKSLIVELYDNFVARVAKGRNLEEDHVRKIAEGRIWMGGDAIENGLVDEFGSMSDAIDLAREMADIDPRDEIELVEFPPRPLLELPSLGPKAPSLFSMLASVADALGGLWNRGAETEPAVAATPPDEDEDCDLQYLRALSRSAGHPVLVMPPYVVPEEWRRSP